MKTCRKCNLTKPLEFFNKKAASKDGYTLCCKTCKKEDAKARYDKNPNVYRERTKATQRVYTAKKFGLTLDDLSSLYIEQNSSCAICGISEKDHGKYLAIDHCHQTGRVRGLLCMACNTGLGNFKDRADLLALAIQYLKGKQ